MGVESSRIRIGRMTDSRLENLTRRSRTTLDRSIKKQGLLRSINLIASRSSNPRRKFVEKEVGAAARLLLDPSPSLCLPPHQRWRLTWPRVRRDSRNSRRLHNAPLSPPPSPPGSLDRGRLRVRGARRERWATKTRENPAERHGRRNARRGCDVVLVRDYITKWKKRHDFLARDD